MEPSNLALLAPIMSLIAFIIIGIFKYNRPSSRGVEKLCEQQKRNLWN